MFFSYKIICNQKILTGLKTGNGPNLACGSEFADTRVEPLYQHQPKFLKITPKTITKKTHIHQQFSINNKHSPHNPKNLKNTLKNSILSAHIEPDPPIDIRTNRSPKSQQSLNSHRRKASQSRKYKSTLCLSTN